MTMPNNGTGEPQLYIIVRNWQRFQHYKDRSPPWIKNHVQLLHNHDYLSLSAGCRSILHGLWLEYASSHARLILDTRSLQARLNLRVTSKQLDTLQKAGFIEYALAPRYQDASATRAGGETEAETETKGPPSPPTTERPPRSTTRGLSAAEILNLAHDLEAQGK